MLTIEDWWRLAGVGSVMMVGTLAVLDAYYPGGLFTLFAQGDGPNLADETYARTMAFTTLMMFQLFNVYNCRSTWRSAFSGFFDNKWLLAAVALLAVHACAGDLCPVPADGVPYGAAVVVRLAGRDGRRGHAADRVRGGEVRVAHGTAWRTGSSPKEPCPRIAFAGLSLPNGAGDLPAAQAQALAGRKRRMDAGRTPPSPRFARASSGIK